MLILVPEYFETVVYCRDPLMFLQGEQTTQLHRISVSFSLCHPVNSWKSRVFMSLFQVLNKKI